MNLRSAKYVSPIRIQDSGGVRGHEGVGLGAGGGGPTAQVPQRQGGCCRSEALRVSLDALRTRKCGSNSRYPPRARGDGAFGGIGKKFFVNFSSRVNFLEYWETRPNGTKRHFSWVTDLPIDESNLMDPMRAGRARWRIENETFNTLKNQGYGFEHNYGHGEKHLATVFAYLTMLAFLIDQGAAALLRPGPGGESQGATRAVLLEPTEAVVSGVRGAGLADAVPGHRLRPPQPAGTVRHRVRRAPPPSVPETGSSGKQVVTRPIRRPAGGQRSPRQSPNPLGSAP